MPKTRSPLQLALPAVAALTAAGLVVVAMAWAWSRPALPPRVVDAPPEHLPAVLPASRNALPAYLAAAKLLRLPPKERRVPLWTALANAKPLPAEAAALASANQAALDGLRAANRVPELQLLPPGTTVKTPLPELAGLQNLVRVATADMRRRLALGDHAGAFARAADVLALGRRLRQGPPSGLIFPLVGVLADDQLHAALRQDAQAVLAAPTPALAAFLRDLNALDRLESPVESALIGERDALLRTLRAGLDPADKIDSEIIGQLGAARFADTTIEVVKNVYDRQIVRVRARELGASAGDVPELAGAAPLKLAVASVLHRDQALGLMIASVAMPSHTGSDEKLLIAEGRADALRVWLARELHRRASGTPPATLAVLVPRWLPAAPADPFAPGRPMAYGGGALWSVALDRRDGGGKPAMPLVTSRDDRVQGVRKVRDGDFVFLTAAGLR